MEIIYIGFAWFMMWYVVKIKRELSGYRKYLNQHNDIYVPSYKEIIESHQWQAQLINIVSQKFQGSKRQKIGLAIPVLRKRISSIGMALIEKRN